MTCSVDEPICLPPIKRGDTWVQIFTFSQGTTPLDITGAHAALQLRRPRIPDPYLSISDADGSLTIDGPAGTVTLRVEADVMATLNPTEYRGDLQLVLDGDPTTTLSSQTFTQPIVEDQAR